MKMRCKCRSLGKRLTRPSEVVRQTGLRSRLLGTTPGHWLVLFFVGCCLQILSMLAWVGSGGNPDYGTGLTESFWVSYILLVDIGTQTGFAAGERGVVRGVAVVISIAGFVYCLTFLGMVVELIRSLLLFWKDKYSKIDAQGHWLILGWGDKTLFLLEELLEAVSSKEEANARCWCPHRQRIVILAEKGVREMQREVQMHFRTKDLQGAYRKLRCISYREGCSAHRVELMKVDAPLAEHILIMCTNETDISSDHEAIRTLLALGAPETETKADVWTEMHNRENARIVHTILPSAQGIVARHAVNRMITLRALVPSVGYAWLKMSTTRSGTQLFLVRSSESCTEITGLQLQDRHKLRRCCDNHWLRTVSPFYECARCQDAHCFFPYAVVCGVKQGADHKSTPLKLGQLPHILEEAWLVQACSTEGDELVMLASSKFTAGCCDALEGGKRSDFRQTYETKISPEVERNTNEKVRKMHNRVLMPDGQIRLGPAADGPQVVLVLGCPDDFCDILDIIDGYVSSSSHIHLLSTRPVQWRQTQLRLNLARLGKLCFDRITVTHHVGSRRDPAMLEKLPLDIADCALVLSEREDFGENAMDSDARNLTIAINLRYVLDCRADAISQHRLKTYRKKCKIVTEIQDPKSQIVLAENSSVRKTGSFVFTSATETGVFAIAVSCKAVYDLFTKLIDPTTNTGHVVAAPIQKYVRGEETLSFFDLCGRVIEKCSGTLLGWRRSDERHPVLNPPEKDRPLLWQSHAADELIILLPATQADSEEKHDPAKPEEASDLANRLPASSSQQSIGSGDDLQTPLSPSRRSMSDLGIQVRMASCSSDFAFHMCREADTAWIPGALNWRSEEACPAGREGPKSAQQPGVSGQVMENYPPEESGQGPQGWGGGDRGGGKETRSWSEAEANLDRKWVRFATLV
ncbi:unnamed protein product, partial [Symbiodinium sp. CCMP2456]